jgi:hypothetical protein
MAAYRERIDDDRLVRVTNHVRTWLFAADKHNDDDGNQTSANPSSSNVPKRPKRRTDDRSEIADVDGDRPRLRIVD